MKKTWQINHINKPIPKSEVPEDIKALIADKCKNCTNTLSLDDLDETFEEKVRHFIRHIWLTTKSTIRFYIKVIKKLMTKSNKA